MILRFLRRNLSVLLILAMGLAALPVQASMIPDGSDLWFTSSSPAISFKKGFKYLGPGAVLSVSGQVVATNKQLLQAFQPRLGLPLSRNLDALSIVGAEDDRTIVFSVGRSFYSKTLGRTITDGDLLTNKGDLLYSNQKLLEAFHPKGSNFGLDAAFVRSASLSDSPEVWFSTARGFYSDALGTRIGAGDILSTSGAVVARASDLLAPFKPKTSADSIGVDSFYVHQEDDAAVYWFSTNKDFYSKELKRWIRANDLLASDGTVLMTQKDFTTNFGLVKPICGNLRLGATALPNAYIPERPDPRPRPPITPEPATLALLLAGTLVGLKRRCC